MSQTTAEVDQLFASAFFNAFVVAMSEACESSWQVAETADESAGSEEAEPIRMALTLGGSLEGEIRLEFLLPEAIALASKLLKQQPAKKFGAKQTEALIGLINAGTQGFCAEFEKNCGVFTIETAVFSGEVPEATDDATDVVRFTASDEATDRLSVAMHLSSSLTESLKLHYKVEEPDLPEAETTETASDSEDDQAVVVSSLDGISDDETTENAKPPKEQVNLELVLDVELNVTLRFGQRQLTLREVLELTSGSVIELDRQVEEPVELLLEGKVIARGEAVVIDGNYGLRVTEVPQAMSSVVLR